MKYVDLNGDRQPVVAVKTPYNDRLGQLSPNGRLIAYESDESGQFEIYVATFPNAEQRWAISKGGGNKARWSHNGRELFFIDATGALQSVAVSADGGFRAGAQTPLFPLNAMESDGYNYAVSADGTRFLVMRQSQKGTPARINVIVNWPAGVR